MITYLLLPGHRDRSVDGVQTLTQTVGVHVGGDVDVDEVGDESCWLLLDQTASADGWWVSVTHISHKVYHP